jgi:hypothetical protein
MRGITPTWCPLRVESSRFALTRQLDLPLVGWRVLLPPRNLQHGSKMPAPRLAFWTPAGSDPHWLAKASVRIVWVGQDLRHVGCRAILRCILPTFRLQWTSA